MQKKLEDLKKTVEKLILEGDNKELYGVVGYLEATLDTIESAIEEYKCYLDDLERDDE